MLKGYDGKGYNRVRTENEIVSGGGRDKESSYFG